MTVFRWSQVGRSWRPVEGEAPEGLDSAQVGLYEVLMTSASAYALSLHADRIARSWERLTGRPFSSEAVPPLPDVRAEGSVNSGQPCGSKCGSLRTGAPWRRSGGGTSRR